MVPHVREAIMFGSAAGLLVCDPYGSVFAGAAIPANEIRTDSVEVRECIRKAKTLGAVLANAGAEHTVLAMLGVQA